MKFNLLITYIFSDRSLFEVSITSIVQPKIFRIGLMSKFQLMGNCGEMISSQFRFRLCHARFGTGPTNIMKSHAHCRAYNRALLLSIYLVNYEVKFYYFYQYISLTFHDSVGKFVLFLDSS